MWQFILCIFLLTITSLLTNPASSYHPSSKSEGQFCPRLPGQSPPFPAFLCAYPGAKGVKSWTGHKVRQTWLKIYLLYDSKLISYLVSLNLFICEMGENASPLPALIILPCNSALPPPLSGFMSSIFLTYFFYMLFPPNLETLSDSLPYHF